MNTVLRERRNILLTYSSRATTDLTQITRKGYAGRTGRLDILVRTLRTIDEDSILVSRLDLGYIMVLEGPPKPPLSIYIHPGFWRECGTRKCLEGEAMEYFRERVNKGIGAEVRRESLFEIVNALGKEGYSLVLLSEEGDPLDDSLRRRLSVSRNTFIVGGYDDPPSWLQGLEGVTMVSLGRTSYLASHAAYFLLKCISMEVK